MKVGGATVLSLLDMPRPFTKLKELDDKAWEQVAADVKAKSVRQAALKA